MLASPIICSGDRVTSCCSGNYFKKLYTLDIPSLNDLVTAAANQPLLWTHASLVFKWPMYWVLIKVHNNVNEPDKSKSACTSNKCVWKKHQSIEHEENWREVNKMFLKAPLYQQACRLFLFTLETSSVVFVVFLTEKVLVLPYIYYNHEWGWNWL